MCSHTRCCNVKHNGTCSVDELKDHVTKLATSHEAFAPVTVHVFGEFHFAPHRGTTAEGLRKGFAEGFAMSSGYVDHGSP